MTEITLDPTVLAIITGALIPLVTGVLTKLDSSTHVKATVALVLSVLVGVATTITADASFTVEDVFEAAGTAFAANLTAYLGVWKAMGKTDEVPLQARTANFGIGKPQE
jgi:hypothetical protein